MSYADLCARLRASVSLGASHPHFAGIAGACADAADAIEALEIQLKIERGRIAHCSDGSILCWEQEREDLRAERDALAAALKKYGNHACCQKLAQMPMEQGRTYICPTDWDNWRDAQPCTCGFEAAMATHV